MSEHWGLAALVRSWWFAILRGIAALTLGAFAITTSGTSLVTLLLWLAAYLVADGLFSLAAGLRCMARRLRWWPMALEGILDLAAAAAIVLWPAAAGPAGVWLIAVWAIVTGITGLLASAVMAGPHGRIFQAASGIASLMLGVALLAWPLIGFVTIAGLAGAYALLFGLLQLAVGTRLRRRLTIPQLYHGSPG